MNVESLGLDDFALTDDLQGVRQLFEICAIYKKAVIVQGAGGAQIQIVVTAKKNYRHIRVARAITGIAALALAAVVTMLIAITPATMAARVDADTALRESGTRASASLGQRRTMLSKAWKHVSRMSSSSLNLGWSLY